MKLRSFAPVAVVAALVAASPSNAPAATAANPWCGQAASQTDRKPDHVAGHQIGVIYAYPLGGRDDFANAATQIVTDLTTVDSWWRRQDGTRAPRFDRYAFPGCASGLGQLDLAKVALPRDSSAYRSLIAGWERLSDDLFGPPFGFSDRHKKYVVYYDGPRDDPDVCGIAGGNPFRGPAFAHVYIQNCWPDLGTGGVMAVTAAHELIHALGAVPVGARNVCPDSAGHVCDSVDDLMFPSTSGQPLDAVVLDVGRDDYYGHSGSWFDVQDSFWLAHLDEPQYPLSVTVSGPGGVASELPGIECPGACSIGWERGTRVTLVPTPSAGARFSGWQGACSGRDACTVAVDAEKDVRATFATGRPGSSSGGGGGGGGTPTESSYRLSVSIQGAGRVRSSPGGIACSHRCSAWFAGGTTVSLRAVASRGWRFAGWGGRCTGRASACRLAMAGNRGIRARFVRA